MKKIIISFIILLIATTVTAQTNYYPSTTGAITKIGYTYKYRNHKTFDVEMTDQLELYNAANPYLDIEWGYKDGSPLSFEDKMGESKIPLLSDSSQTIKETLSMVDGLFTTQQKTTLKGKSMFIELRIDPSTGKIADIYFSFFRDGPFMNIPVETYRSIELALKQNLTVTVTAEGRKFNYIELFWSHKF